MIRPLKEPCFIFREIPPYEDLSFERLTTQNFKQLYLMFKEDENSFTDERFKHYEKAKKYAEYLEQYGAYSPKHGGQDWLFLWKEDHVGILHLYDLSLETFAENNRRCWIGFATKPEVRRKGVTKKALLYFIQYIFKNYPFITFIHAMALKENLSSQALLKSVGFVEDLEERVSKVHRFFVIEKKQ